MFYFFIQYYIITMIANCGKDWFPQIGVGVGSSVQYQWAYLQTIFECHDTIFQVISKLPSFSSRNL